MEIEGREEMEVVECAQPELSREEERLLIRDITVAAEANSKEGDTFYLINYRSLSPPLFRLDPFSVF